MSACPDCGKRIDEPKKTWKYWKFDVKAYSCDCGTTFNEYLKNGKHNFMLKRKKGTFGNFKKV